MSFIGKYIATYSAKKKKEKFFNTIQTLHPLLPNTTVTGDTVNIQHSGPLGDIIYAIPAMKALSDGKKINLLLSTKQETNYSSNLKHYGQGKTLTKGSIEAIRPLLLAQDYIKDVMTDAEVTPDYNMDIFRKYPFDYRMGHIARWYFHVFGVNANLSNSWLTVPPNDLFKSCIVISRSFRFRTPGIDYSFLKKFSPVVFVGLAEEYEEMKQNIPSLEYKKVSDFLELAAIIKGSKLFIGNQSFPFALAEALKVKRVLEVSYEYPNVIVDGENGYDFCYQPQFEKIVNSILEMNN